MFLNCSRMLLCLVAVTMAIRATRPVLAEETSSVKAGAAFLEKYCYDCHGNGGNDGQVALGNEGELDKVMGDRVLWGRIWDNVLTKSMPPADMPQPSDEERQAFSKWVAESVYHLEEGRPATSRVVIRRLNRPEYHYAVEDLLGVSFSVDDNFPPDDTGYGFDTIGDVLTIPPSLMEKYFLAAEDISEKIRESAISHMPTINGSKNKTDKDKDGYSEIRQSEYYVKYEGDYELAGKVEAGGDFSPYYGTIEIALVVDGKDIGNYRIDTTKKEGDISNSVSPVEKVHLEKGNHVVEIRMKENQVPEDQINRGEHNDKPQIKADTPRLKGPLDGSHNYYDGPFYRVFTEGAAPQGRDEQTAYAGRILDRLASRAFRRPLTKEDLDRLLAVYHLARDQHGGTFEGGVSQGIMAILVSPRFLLREELGTEPEGNVEAIDEFSLASRLSFFLWSSLPDDELFGLAKKGELRAHLKPQVERMIKDAKSERFVQNFVGQWLMTRDVLGANKADKEFSYQVRQGFKQETEMFFGHILRENRPIGELISADYTFLNEPLAEFYGINGVKGRQMQKTQLDPQSHRGGLLTQGSILMVTSNPNRTSPVKRGKFILENILGTPPPPPPELVPDLEDAKKDGKRPKTLREQLAIHREDSSCASCHNRMDPLGLALENFDFVGRYREKERDIPIDPGGKLVSGRSFSSLEEFKAVIAEQDRLFIRCLVQKLMTYALGRGIEPEDNPTIEAMVDRLQANGSHLQTAIEMIVESSQFQMRPNLSETGSLSQAETKQIGEVR